MSCPTTPPVRFASMATLRHILILTQLLQRHSVSQPRVSVSLYHHQQTATAWPNIFLHTLNINHELLDHFIRIGTPSCVYDALISPQLYELMRMNLSLFLLTMLMILMNVITLGSRCTITSQRN